MNVLIVDDDVAVAQYCRTVLEGLGHFITLAHSGAEALALLEEREIDLVLSDVRMPGMNGLELLAAIPRTPSSPGVILFTGYGTVPSAVEAMRLGAHDYILKPVSPGDLSAAVRRWEEVRTLREENRLLRLQLESEQGLGGMVAGDPSMKALFSAILRIAPKRHAVLITGETGTGKELVARALHSQGPNAAEPFVAVDCGALPAGLVESELFGHVRGAYTGAAHDRAGLLAAAGRGTLFLDEIGELPLDMQARLFRVLQEREFRPVGSDTARKFEARVVAATDRDLEQAMRESRFRPELYYRLNVHHLHVPPLRERKSDIPALVRHFIRKHGDDDEVVVGADLMAALTAHRWPGNVRELENCVLHMLADAEEPALGRRHLPRTFLANAEEPEGQAAPPAPEALSPLDEAERTAIQAALEQAGGSVFAAARALGISKATLYRKLDRYGIAAGKHRTPPVQQG